MSKQTLLLSRLPEPEPPDQTTALKEKNILEGLSTGLRFPLANLEEWTQSPDDESIGLLDAIRIHMENADSTKLRCGAVTKACIHCGRVPRHEYDEIFLANCLIFHVLIL